MNTFNINLCLPDTGYSNLSGRLYIRDTSEDDTHEKQKADEDKISDKSHLSMEPSATEDFISEKRDSSKDEGKTDQQSVSDQKDVSQHSITVDEEDGKSISEDSKREETVKTAMKKTLSEESKTLSSRQSEEGEPASSSAKDKITDLTGEKEEETLTKQISVKESFESTEETESKEDDKLNKHDETSTGVSSTESMLTVEKTLSPGKASHDEKSENVKELDSKEQPETETSKSKIYLKYATCY